MKEPSERLVLPDEAEYPPGLTERYELLECFSSGRETQTLLARARDGSGLVTVKCFPREHPLYEMSEPEVLRHMKSDPLPRYVEEFRSETMRCTVREYVEGETLNSYAAHHPMSAEEILRIGIALCDQLHALHSLVPPVIHRDVKPQNIIVRDDGTPVLIDFGISRVHSEKKADTVVFGTEGFAPPEQYGFAQTDGRSDIYSLGMVLNWLMQGSGDIRKGTGGLERVIRRMTAFDPEHRYASALHARKALEHAMPAERRRRMILAGAALLFLIILSGAAVFLLRPSSAPVFFENPLVEQAVRLNLGLGPETEIRTDMLSDVTGIYIVADRAYADSDSFYDAISQWYASGRSIRGDLENLEELAAMPNLEQVCVVAQMLSDISTLSGMKHLNKVEFKHNSIRFISCLAGMEKLNYVGINDNPVKELSPLIQCPQLAYLDVCDVHRYDPVVFAQLGDFQYLDIANRTQSYHYLGQKRIVSLRAAWTGMNTLDELSGVTGLEELDISHTPVSDLAPITVHQGLRRLNMASTAVRDLTPLLDLPELESVTLSKGMKEAAEQSLSGAGFEIKYE